MAPALRMIVRNMERRPLRTALSIGGVAAAVAIVIMGNFFRDAIEVVVDTQFTPRPARRRDGVDGRAGGRRRAPRAGAPARRDCRSSRRRFVPVRFVNGHRRERSLIRGYAARAELLSGHRRRPAASRCSTAAACVLTDRLADKLGLRVGDTVRVEVLEGRERTLELPVERDGARDDGPERLHGPRAR